MAIGARITSENLSGKTATVTFIPYTGSTSGSTVNLGTKTIPFNNINTHPYGVYNLYFAEYDYTYTLTVDEPDLSIQSFVYVARMVGSDDFGVGMLNFNDFTAEIVDLNIDSTLYYCNGINELTNSGYMYEFRDDATEDERIVIFTDANNIEIGRYTGTTSNRSRNSLEGRWVTYEDVNNGVLKYSDGVSVYTYTWDPDTHYIDIEWDYDAITSDGTFIIKKREVEPLSGWTYNGNGSSYIVNPNDGTTSLFKTWTDGTWVRHHMVPSNDTIHVLTSTSGDTYTNYQIYDSAGTILETISLTGATYNSYDGIFHGANKHTIAFYNNNDVNVAYKIVHYNGDTQTLIETSHNRGTEYVNINMNGDRNFWSTSTDRNNGAIVIQFYNNGNGTNYGQEVAFCDIMYMFNNQTSFTTYTFANDDSGKRISSWGQLSDIFRVACVNGDGVASVLTIMSGSTRIESLNINAVDVNGYNDYYLGNKSIHQIWTNDGNNVTYKYINQLGVVTDTLDNYSLISAYASGADSQGQNAYISIQSEGNIGFYVYSGTTGFTQTDYYGTTSTPSTYASDTFKENTEMVLFTDGDLGFRILSSTGITQEFFFPEYTDFSINVGKTKFMFVYQDYNDNDTVKIRLYNFAGTLLNSATTTWTGWSDTWGVNERFIVRNGNVNGIAEIYLVSEDNITSLEFQTGDVDTEINDYIYNSD